MALLVISIMKFVCLFVNIKAVKKHTLSLLLFGSKIKFFLLFLKVIWSSTVYTIKILQ